MKEEKPKMREINEILNAMKLRELADSGMTLSEFCARYRNKDGNKTREDKSA